MISYTTKLFRLSIFASVQKCHFNSCIVLKPNLPFNLTTLIRKKNFHKSSITCIKLRVEHENSHLYNCMRSLPAYKRTLVPDTSVLNYENVDQQTFDEMLSRNWRQSSATDIVAAFKHSVGYCKQNNIALADKRFNNLVDGLMDKIQDLTDDELSQMLILMRAFPYAESITDDNFHDMWSALDDMCVKRISEWNLEKILYFADHWYLLGLSKYCEFTIEVIKRACRKARHLSSSELVQSLFYINILRKQWDIFNFEVQLEKYIDKLSTDELAIISLGFFKTKSRIKGTFLLGNMLSKLLQETETIHEITLTAILKILRYSPHIELADQIYELSNKLVPEVDRLSLLCCVHIALMGTNTQIFHEEILNKISNKFINNLPQARLKDLERLAFSLTQFNYDPKTNPCIFQSILSEITKPERKDEINKHPRSLASCVHYLGLRQTYSYDLINRIMSQEFIEHTYGTNKKSMGREALFINNSLSIDCPDYKGNCLPEKLRRNLAMWMTDWVPEKNQKRYSAADRLLMDISQTLEHLYGEECVHIDHVLPHFQRADIIICKNENNEVVRIQNFTRTFGDIVPAPEKPKNCKWLALITVGWNNTIRGSEKPVGLIVTKMRQLEKIGYKPVMVTWNTFAKLSQEERYDYIKRKISEQ